MGNAFITEGNARKSDENSDKENKEQVNKFQKKYFRIFKIMGKPFRLLDLRTRYKGKMPPLFIMLYEVPLLSSFALYCVLEFL